MSSVSAVILLLIIIVLLHVLSRIYRITRPCAASRADKFIEPPRAIMGAREQSRVFPMFSQLNVELENAFYEALIRFARAITAKKSRLLVERK